MRFLDFTVPFLGLAVFPHALASTLHERDCPATLDSAVTVATRLQSFFNTTSGQYNGGGRWTDANAVEDIYNLMWAAGTSTWYDVGDTWGVIQASKDPNVNWPNFMQGFNDDAQWVILGLWKIAELRSTRGEDDDQWFNTGRDIYSVIASEWDESICGGGMWWNTDHQYKNAITNELFLLTSSVGYKLTSEQSYLDNANKAWAWLRDSGMRNSDGLWNDGLDSNCQNNGQNAWTYNQGVIASGLGALASITSDTSLLDEAEITMDAAVNHLTVDGFVKEICDDATQSTCNGDSELFKGLMMKHWQYYLDSAADSTRTAKYSAFLSKQSEGALNSKTADNDIGSNWYATTGSLVSVQSTTAGLEAIIAAAKYGTC